MARLADDNGTVAAMLAAMAREVREARARRGWSRRQLAEGSGVSERFIAEVESAEANPSLASMAALAGALGLTVNDLLGGSWRPVPRLAGLVRTLSEDDQNAAADWLEARAARLRPGVRVALVGLRGAGKTTVGKLVARRLGATFVELDQQVEQQAGLTLAQLFDLHGEPSYRGLELAALRGLLSSATGDTVVATGGGLPAHGDAWELLRAGARTVWLKTRPEVHLARVFHQGDRRPMADRPRALAEAQALLAAREPAYARAELTIDTTSLSPVQTADRIVAWLRETASVARSRG